MPLTLALSRTVTNWTVTTPEPLAVAGKLSTTARFIPPEAENTSKFVRTCEPFTLTLNRRLPDAPQ